MTSEARLHRANGALTTLSNGRHVWSADISKEQGSDDLAPNPHELLDASLAACTALTLELYIRRHALTVRDLLVTVDHVEAKDSDGNSVYELKRTIHVDGELTQADSDRLLAIAEKCPIHRILEGQVGITTSLET